MLTQDVVVKLILQHIGGAKLKPSPLMDIEGLPSMVRTAPMASLVTSLSQYGSTGQEIRDNLLKNPRAESANKILSAIPQFESAVNTSTLTAPQKSIVQAAVDEFEQSVEDFLRHTNILSGKEIGDPLAEQSQAFIDEITAIAANAANGSAAAANAWAAANAAWANAQAAFANAQSALDYALLATGAANLAGDYAVAAQNWAYSANSSASAANGFSFLAAGHASSANTSAFQANLAAVSANSSAASANSSAVLSANYAGQANSAAIVAQQYAADANSSAANAYASTIITAGHVASANGSAIAAAANAVAAEGFAVSANNSAANAASQVTLAANFATNANNSAAAAAANAISAESSAVSANTSAASANASSVLAAGYATNANNSANAAAANAVLAQGYATSANSSAANAAASTVLAASYATESQANSQARGLTPNFDFKNGTQKWVRYAALPEDPVLGNGGWAANDGGALGVWYNTPGVGSSNIYSALTPINPARKYKIRGRVYSSGHTGIIYVGATSHDADGVPIGTNNGHNYITGWVGSTKTVGWHDIESPVLTGEGASADLGNWFRLGTKQVRVFAFLNYNSGASQQFVLDSLWIEDVTDIEAAAAQAVIANAAAVSANASAASASASSILSADYATNSVQAATQAFPTTFVNMGTLASPTFWTGDSDSPTIGMASIGSDSYGPFVRSPVGSYGVIARKGKSPNFVKKKWKIRVLVAHESGTQWTCEVRLGYYPDPIPLNAGRITIDSAPSQIITSTTPIWIEKEFTAQGHPYVKPEVVMNYPVAQATTVQRIYAIEMIDVDANKMVYNLDFENGMSNWGTTDNGTGPDIGKPKFDRDSTSYFGRPTVLRMQPNTTSSLFYKELIPVDTSRKYKISTWVATYAESPGTTTGVTSTFYVGFVGCDAAGNVLDHGSFGSYRYCTINGGSWGHGSGSGDTSQIVTGEGNDSWQKFPPGTKFIRPMAILNYYSTNTNSYIDYIKIEDVTESLAANASATIAQAAAVSANSSAASAFSSSTLAASMGRGYLNPNSNFADWPNINLAPQSNNMGWAIWSGGLFGAGQNRRLGMADMSLPTNNRPEGSDWVYNAIVLAGGNDVGILSVPTELALGPGTYTVEATAQLMDGSFSGSGVLVYMFNSSNVVIQSEVIRFNLDPDTTGFVGGNYLQRRWSKNFTAIGGTASIRLYAMGNWNGGLMGAGAYKVISFYKVGIKAGDATDALVVAQGSAIANLQGVTATYLLKTSAGSGTATVELRATDSGGVQASTITMLASAIRLGNSTSSTPTLEISNGVAQFSGELNVGGSSGGRVNIYKNVIKIFNDSGVLVMKMGNLSL